MRATRAYVRRTRALTWSIIGIGTEPVPLVRGLVNDTVRAWHGHTYGSRLRVGGGGGDRAGKDGRPWQRVV